MAEIARERKTTAKTIRLAGKQRDILPVLGLLIVILVFNLASGGKVFTAQNFSALFNETFMIMLASFGGIFVVAQGKMDMSIAAIAATSAAIAAYASQISIYLILPVALAVGLALGFLNGLIVSKLRVDSFITTIAMSFILKGVVELLLANGAQAIPYELLKLDEVWIKLTVTILLGIVFYTIFTYTAYGKRCRAIGSREEAARETGIKIENIQYISYMVTGAIAGLIAFFSLTRSGSATIGTATNLEFNTLQALMLGGVVLSGGSSVKFRFAIIGSITMAVISNGLTLSGVETAMQQMIQGALFLIVVAATFDRRNVEIIK